MSPTQLGVIASALSTRLPDSIVLHWAADDLGLPNGANVTSWVDRIASHTLTPPNTAPTFVTNSQNGLPGVSFARTSSQYLQAPAFSLFRNDTEGTIFSVLKQVSYSSAGNGTILSVDRGAALGFQRLLISTQATTGLCRFACRRLDADALTTLVAATTTLTNNVAQMVYAQMNWSSGVGSLHVDGATTISGTLSSSGSTSDTDSIGQFIGAVHGSGVGQSFFDGYIYELIIYERVLTIAEIAIVEAYLGAKWGI